MATDKKRNPRHAFHGLDEATLILKQAQFARPDVLAVTGLTEAQLKNTLDRDLVRLHSQHNPGTGRRRMFTGGDILKIISAHTMSAIGFPMKWIYLIADDIEWRAQHRLAGLEEGGNFCLVTYPQSNGDWARIAFSDAVSGKRRLPAAFQILEVDRLIDETLAKLNAAIAEEPIPDFSVPDIPPEPSLYSPENDFFRKWSKDAEGRAVLVGLTFEETREIQQFQEAWLNNRHDHENLDHIVELQNRHEIARIARVCAEIPQS